MAGLAHLDKDVAFQPLQQALLMSATPNGVLARS